MTFSSRFDGTQESRLLCRAIIPKLEILGEKPLNGKESDKKIELPTDVLQKPVDVASNAEAISDAAVAPSVDAGLHQLDSKAKKAALVPTVVGEVGGKIPESIELATPLTPGNTEITTSQESELVTLVKKTGKDIAAVDAGTWASYGFGGLLGAVGAVWVWEKLVGSKDSDGLLKKGTKMMLTILTAIVGAKFVSGVKDWWNKEIDSPFAGVTSFLSSPLSFLGITNHKDTASPEPSDPNASKDGIFESPSGALSAGRDITQGGYKALDTLIIQPVVGAVEVLHAFSSGHPEEALDLIKDKGWSLFLNDDGEIVVLDTLFLPITAPFRATKNIFTPDGRKSEGFWMVWGTAGGAYLIAKKTAELWKTGANPIPKNVTAVLNDAIHILAGPIDSWVDAAKLVAISLKKDGLKALRIQLGPQSVIGRRILNWGNYKSALVIKNEGDALKLLSKFESLSEDFRIMRDNPVIRFSEERMKAMERLMNQTVSSVFEYVNTQKSLQSSVLTAIKNKAAILGGRMDKAAEEVLAVLGEHRNAASGSALQSADIAEDVVDGASDSLKIADTTGDSVKTASTPAYVIDEASDVVPFPRAAQALPDSGLAHAVGDGVESLPQAAVATEEVAEVANPNGLKIFNPNPAVVPVESVESVSAPVKAAEASAVASVIDTVGDLKQTQIDALMKQKAIASGLAQIGESGKGKLLALCDQFDVDTLIQFNRSPKAQGLLIGALQAADETEATRLVQAATKAGGVMRSISAGAGALGMAGDVFSIAIAIADFNEYGNKIQATKNPALAAFYSQCQLLCAAEGTASAVGLAYQGAAFVGSIKAGGGIVTALGTPAGLIAIPVTLAAVGVGLTRRGLQESVEYHSVSEADMLSYPPGKIVEHIAKSTSASNLNWTQGLFLENSVLANRSAREEAYCGYFRQIAIESVSPYSFDELTQEKRTSLDALHGDARDTAEKQALIDAHRAGISQFVLDAYQYAKLVDSNYEKPPVQTLKYAEIFAKLQSVRRRSGQDLLPLSLEKINFEISKHLLSEAEDTAKILPLLSQYPERAAEMFLGLVRHDLALAEYNILSTNYSNLSEASTDETMQAFARGMLAEEIWNTLRTVTRKLRETGTVSPEEVSSTLKTLQNTLLPKRDVNALAIECSKKSNALYFQNMGQMPGRLSILGLRDLMNTYRLTKSDELGSDASTALPSENLLYYYSDKIKANAPIYLKLPAAKEQGFLALKGAYWVRHSAHADKECTPVVQEGESTSIALEKGIHQFWKESSMPSVTHMSPDGLSDPWDEIRPIPNKAPDFSIVVE